MKSLDPELHNDKCQADFYNLQCTYAEDNEIVNFSLYIQSFTIIK